MDTDNTTCTALSICNTALCKIGEAPLEEFSPNLSSAARICHLHYHPARRETLCMSRWSFAARADTLECIPEDERRHSRYPWQFSLPADCLRVMDVECDEWTMRGRKIQATSRTLPITYIADIEDCRDFDPLFIEAFATHLAAKLAVPLTSNHTLRQNLVQEFHRIILPLAATTNAVQSYSNDENPLANLLGRRRRWC